MVATAFEVKVFFDEVARIPTRCVLKMSSMASGISAGGPPWCVWRTVHPAWRRGRSNDTCRTSPVCISCDGSAHEWVFLRVAVQRGARTLSNGIGDRRRTQPAIEHDDLCAHTPRPRSPSQRRVSARSPSCQHAPPPWEQLLPHERDEEPCKPNGHWRST